MTDVKRILVVGGGIGGLTTTVALRNAGFDVDVVEKNPAWDVYGVGIIQPGNALRALHQLGLAEAAVAQGQPITGDAAWLGDGVTQLADNDWPPLVPGLPPGNGITTPGHFWIAATPASAASSAASTVSPKNHRFPPISPSRKPNCSSSTNSPPSVGIHHIRRPCRSIRF